MKRFLKSLGGKALLFVLCVISAFIVAAGVVGAWLFWEEDIYTNSETYMLDRYHSSQIMDSVYNYASYALTTDIPYRPENCEICIRDNSGKIVKKTLGYDELEKSPEKDSLESFDFMVYARHQENGSESFDVFRISSPYHTVVDNFEGYTAYSVHAYRIYTGIDLQDEIIALAYLLRFAIYPIILMFVILFFFCFVALMWSAGRSNETGEFKNSFLGKLPFDVMVALWGCAVLFWFVILDSGIGYVAELVLGGCGMVVAFCGVLGLCILFAENVKTETLWRNSLTGRCCTQLLKPLKQLLKFCKQAASHLHEIPLIWKSALFAGVLCFAELFGIYICRYETDNLVLLWILEKILLVPAFLFAMLMLRKLQKAGEALAEGNLSYRADTKTLYWDLKKHAENLNSIGNGMSLAVEQRMKSERMKTELITNVSHDIKTPLTSIINYSQLIGQEECDNERIKEYSQVLLRQSEKLKRLIEDLVEASKASTGNLEVELVPCDAGMFIAQSAGEYEEKLRDAELQLITKKPDEPVIIMADPRRMWRVFDNLMGNACKYSQPNTRVYLSLEQKDQQALITLKNTSREPLNITPEELMERFVRGDSSRHTEGNGLGLSIARSLTELQNGQLRLDVDGDLFKITLILPCDS